MRDSRDGDGAPEFSPLHEGVDSAGGFSPNRRPLVGIALVFLAGTAFGWAVLPAPWLAIPLAVASLVLAFRGKRASHQALGLWLSVVCVGWAHAAVARNLEYTEGPRSLMRRPAEALAVRGVVSDQAWIAELPGHDPEFRFSLHVEAINRTGEWVHTRARARCRMVAVAGGDAPVYGDRWECQGVLEYMPDTDASWKGSVPYRLRIDENHAQRVEANQGSPILARCLRARAGCARILSQGIEAFPTHQAVVKALLLGYREGLPKRLEETFSRTGTLHVFAISGLHVGVMAMLVAGGLRALGLGRHHWPWILAPLLVAYAMATGMKPSALRAAVMTLLVVAAPLFKRRPDLPSALGLAALIILTVKPGQVVAPGFCLSFVVVSGILLLYPVFHEPLRRRLAPDPWRLQPEGIAMRWGRAVGGYLAALAALSVACWCASAPLTARWFNILSPIALVGNLVVVPGSFLVVLTSCLSLLTGWASPWMAEVFNHANRWIIDGLLASVDGLGAVPGGFRFVPSPSLPLIGLWYGLLVGWLFLRPVWQKRCALPLALCLGTAAIGYPFARPVQAHLLSTGSGLCLHVDDQGSQLMVNPGPRWMAYDLQRHLREQGVSRLEHVVVTGWPTGGAESLLESVPVGALWIHPFSVSRPEFEPLLRLAAERGVRVRSLAAPFEGRLHTLEWDAAVLAGRYADRPPVWIRLRGERVRLLYGTEVPDALTPNPFLEDAGVGAAPAIVVTQPVSALEWMPEGWGALVICPARPGGDEVPGVMAIPAEGGRLRFVATKNGGEWE